MSNNRGYLNIDGFQLVVLFDEAVLVQRLLDEMRLDEGVGEDVLEKESI